MGEVFSEIPFVVDAETLEYVLGQDELSQSRLGLLAAIQNGQVLVTMLTMKQLKENCRPVYDILRSVGVAGISTNRLNEPTNSMLKNAKLNGFDVRSPALRAKMYALALASSNGCCVISVDCRDTQISTLTLAKHFSIRVKCLGVSW